MQPITKQLIIGVFILALVTVASLGIRHIRFSANQAKIIESPVIVEAEPDHYLADPHTVVAEPDPQYADALDSDKETPIENHSETKSFKGDYAKSKGSKGLEKVSLSDYENLYITEEGEHWYVSEESDGKTVKMRVQIDEITGEMAVIDISGGKYGGLQPIPMGDGYNIYITEEGQTWYVGGGSKAQVEIDDTTGEITIIEQFSGNDDK